MKTITEDEWIEQYKPTLNIFHNDPDQSWNGTVYETFGEELAHVQKINDITPQFVWTLLDSDGFAIVSGYHHVNRFGYFITELPADEDFIDVVVEDLTDHDEEELDFINSED